MRKIRHKRPVLLIWWGSALVIWVFLAVFIRGEEAVIHLKNGDRLTGNIRLETEQSITLKTPYGEVIVPKDQIARREPNSGSTNAPAGLTNAPTGLTNAPAVKGTAPALSAPAPGLTSTNAAAKPPEPSEFMKFLLRWKGEIQMGANLGFSTKNRQTYTGRIKGDYVEGPLHNILDYDATYGRAEGVLSDNRMDGSWKLEYDIGKRLLVYNAVGGGYDEIQKIRLKYDVGPGVGYKFVVLTNFVFKGEMGANYQQQYYSDHTQKSRYSLRIAEDSWWQANTKLRLDEKLEVFPQLDELGQYRIRGEMNFNYLLGKHLTFTISGIDSYESEVPLGVSHNDLQVRALLGYKF